MIKIQKSTRRHAFLQAWGYFWYLPITFWYSLKTISKIVFSFSVYSMFPVLKGLLYVLLGQLASLLLPFAAIFTAIAGYSIDSAESKEG